MNEGRTVEPANRSSSLIDMMVVEFDFSYLGLVFAHTDTHITILQNQIFFGLISKKLTICKTRIDRIEWAKETIFLKPVGERYWYLPGSIGINIATV